MFRSGVLFEDAVTHGFFLWKKVPILCDPANMFEIHPVEGFHFSQCLKDRIRGGGRLLRRRGSSVVHRFSGSFVAVIFFMVGFTCSVPVVHARGRKARKCRR